MPADALKTMVVAVIAAFALVTTSCAFRLPESAVPELVVFSSWVGIDADRFDQVLAGFTEQTGITVRNTGSANFEADLLARVNEGDAPDVAVSPQPGLVDDLVASGQIMPLRGAAASAAGQAYQPLVDLVSHDGEIWGAWFELSVKSLVWFDPDVLANYGDRPTSLLAESTRPSNSPHLSRLQSLRRRCRPGRGRSRGSPPGRAHPRAASCWSSAASDGS